MQQYPFIFSDRWKYRIQRHAAFWTFWWLFQGFLYSFLTVNSPAGYFKRLPIAMVESFFFMSIHIFLAYSLMYFVIPRFLLKQKYWQTALWTFVFFLLTAGMSTLVGRLVVDQLRASLIEDPQVLRSFKQSTLSFHLSLMAGLRGGITIGGIAAAIKLMKYWYVKEQRNLQLQKENSESQLQLLKAQVHPHFLFNTLNNIYSYTQNTSPVASKLVTGLSDLLRFILYESGQPFVPLSKELKMIRDYIGLEKIRYGNKLDLQINLPDKTDDFYIAPLLLLPLIENCFKHGTSNILEHPWISLQIDLQGRQMHMKLLNGKVNELRKNGQLKGIGIQNVKKRLDLLYPGKHDFLITDDEDVFIVNLKIELKQKREPIVNTTTTQPEPIHA
jgi:sensor histidine kinase YesM